jgi:hypothetical protein
MAKQRKPAPVTKRDPITTAKAVGPLLGAMMVPAQIRLASREAARPMPFVPPKARAKRGRS